MSSFLGIIEAASSLVFAIAARWDQRSDHEEKTIVAISRAFHATQGYHAQLGSGAKRDPRKEWEIAGYWDEASIYVRRYDPDLAQRLDLKGNYWRRPEIWSQKEVDDARIGLDSVKLEADRLLRTR